MSIPAVNVFGASDWYRTIREQIQHEDARFTACRFPAPCALPALESPRFRPGESRVQPPKPKAIGTTRDRVHHVTVDFRRCNRIVVGRKVFAMLRGIRRQQGGPRLRPLERALKL